MCPVKGYHATAFARPACFLKSPGACIAAPANRKLAGKATPGFIKGRAPKCGCAPCTGMPGWQWLFIIEGLLTVVYGICVKLLLAPKPSTAWFLQPAEREWLQQRQDNVHAGAVATSGGRGSTILGAR